MKAVSFEATRTAPFGERGWEAAMTPPTVSFDVHTSQEDLPTVINQVLSIPGVKSLRVLGVDSLDKQPRARRLPPSRETTASDEDDANTMIVPAQKEGFENVFLGRNEWWSVRIHDSMAPKIKWIAAYQVDPVRAITHIAKVLRIEPSTEPGKPDYKRIVFAEPAKEIGPIPYGKELKPGAMRGPRYTSFKQLSKARSMADLMRLDQDTVWKLISRPDGATVADIRQATGYMGAIKSGPERAAEAHDCKLLIEGENEDRRFTIHRS